MSELAEGESSDCLEQASSVHSPAREEEPDEDRRPCPECQNYRDNALRAFTQATNSARLMARNYELEKNLAELKQSSSSAACHIEDTYERLKEAEIARDSLQSEVRVSSEENHRLKELNESYLEAARLTDKHRQAADDWRKKYIQSNTVLLEKSAKYEDLEEKYKKAVDLVKATLSSSTENAKKAVHLKNELQLKSNESRNMKKHWNTVVGLLADISRQSNDVLPDGIRNRLNKLPIDELLLNGKTGAGATHDSDDDDAEAVHRLMSADGGESHFAAVSPPRKARGAAKNMGNRGGRGGRSMSMAFERIGGKNVIDESMHENLLARKLHRNEHEPQSAAHSDPAGKSVMGRKTETVKEQQERQKEGRKERIAELKTAELKKAHSDKPSQSKPIVGPPASLEDDVLMRDESALDLPDEVLGQSDEVENVTSGTAPAPATVPSTSYDNDLDLFFETEDGGALAADDEAGSANVVASSSAAAPSKLPSPSKMIQHPKVVELAQDRADVDLTKREKKHKELVVQMGMDLSDSEGEEEEEERHEERRRTR
ncbi:hypothetical protein PENTCL1PPCAC_19960, partial [Pristionchus entomophagus]